MAEKRAAAAEIIAKEANAARLKALLDAAREQESARTIRSAEARFAAARTEWERVRQGVPPEPDPYAEFDAPEPAAWGPPPLEARLPRMAAFVRARGIQLGMLAMVLLIGSIGAAAYLRSVEAPSAGTAQVAQPSQPAADAPAAAQVDTLAKVEPMEPVSTKPAAAPVKKAPRPRIARVPRIRPGEESLAESMPAPVERPSAFSNVE